MKNEVSFAVAILLAYLLAISGADENPSWKTADDVHSNTEEDESSSPSYPASVLENEEIASQIKIDLQTTEEEPSKEEGSTSTSTTPHENATHTKRPWGSSGAGHLHAVDTSSSNTKQASVNTEANTEIKQSIPNDTTNEKDSENDTTASTANHPETPHHGLPFVPPKPTGHSHASLQGFTLSGRIYIDESDKLVHFDDLADQIEIPYGDCSAAGAMTAPIPIKNGYFGQALSPGSPTSWRGTDGKHPILAVALSPLLIELNSGEAKTFQAGDVVLLEDVLLPGHRMRSLSGAEVKVLYLTLPNKHYQVGKGNVSVHFPKQRQVPCGDAEGAEEFNEVLLDVSSDQRFWNARRLRVAALGIIATSLSTLAVDFLGKTAPLWLAVGIGGSCFVVGSTIGLTVGADNMISAVELWREQRKLGRPAHDPFLEEEPR